MSEIHVVKIGGKVAEDKEKLDKFLDSFNQLTSKKVLVHGGGVTATKLAEKLGIPSKMIDGRRITDAQTLDVVTMVYGGLVNKKLVAKLQAMNVNAVGLTGADLNILHSIRRDPNPIDFGYVGDIDKVNGSILHNLILSEVVPVLAPLTHDGMGSMLNTNADAIASFVARELAKKSTSQLTLCFDMPGVMQDGKTISELTWNTYQELKDNKIVADGMIPKLDLGFAALNNGVRSVRLTRFDLLHHTELGTELKA